MSTGISGLFKGTAGAIADEMDAPIGFDETLPEESESVVGVHAFPCRDHAPRTICPALTNGGRLRAMDNHQLAEWLEEFARNPNARDADVLFMWLNQPYGNGMPDAPQ